MTGRADFGRIGEEIAARFLERKGYTVVGLNYRKPWGEIDIIAEKAGTVRFVEVKAVSREKLPPVTREMDGRPEERIDIRKLRKLARTAAIYMEETNDDREFQIDAVGVIVERGSRTARCRLFEQIIDDL
jgi:putative endonuclease